LTALANILLLFLTIINRLITLEPAKATICSSSTVPCWLWAPCCSSSTKFVIFFLLIRQTWYILEFFLFKAFEGRFFKQLTANPPATLMLSFALVISIGTILLMMPAASSSNQVTNIVDALFTATSATCVTGLTVVDTGSHFSFFGQLVILVLIQIGGLGIMTISTAFAIMLGQRITLKLESVMYDVVGGSQSLNVLQLLKSIVLATLLIESLGAVLLYTRFSAHYLPLEAFYMSVFHSVSAFCNAGFSLMSENMMGYVSDIVMNLGITFLIILGGLGFTVIVDLNRYLFYRERVKKLSLHSKIVLITTGSLLLLES
jgi:trk system potassium uptake protein TrkH